MKEIEKLTREGEIMVKTTICQDWNIHYNYIPWNMGDPEDDKDYFETVELNENLPAEVEFEISGMNTSNKKPLSITLNHLFKNSKLYEKEIIKSIIEYIFGDNKIGTGYKSAMEQANRIDNKNYTKEEFIKRSCSLNSVSIKNVEKNGLNYISFYFNCGWDEEHGVTVICLNGNAVITSHGADLASRNGENLINAINYEIKNN